MNNSTSTRVKKGSNNERYAAQWQKAAAEIDAVIESMREAGFPQTMMDSVREKLRGTKVEEQAKVLLDYAQGHKMDSIFSVSEFGYDAVKQYITESLTALKTAMNQQNDAWAGLYTGLADLVRMKAHAHASQNSKSLPNTGDYVSSVVSEFSARIPDMMRNYEPSKGLVSTYAQHYMLRTCLDVAREFQPIQTPRSVQDACNRYMNKMAALPDGGKDMDRVALMGYLGWGPRQLAEVKWWTHHAENVVHIDASTQDDEDETPNAELADPRCHVEDDVIRDAIVRDVQRAITFAIRDYGIIVPNMDYDTALALLNNDVSVARVARELQCSDAAVHNFRSMAIARLTEDPLLKAYSDKDCGSVIYALRNLRRAIDEIPLELAPSASALLEYQECATAVVELELPAEIEEPIDFTNEF